MIGGDIVNKIYMCIDLKSFYASVECRERGLDPLDTNLVVADESRTDKTICLAVSPSLKSYLEDADYLKQNKKLKKSIIKEERIIIINHLLRSHLLHQN